MDLLRNACVSAGGVLPMCQETGTADRQARAVITPEGVFLEQLERDPARFLPDVTDDDLSTDVVRVDLVRP